MTVDPLDGPEQLLVDVDGEFFELQNVRKAGIYQLATGQPKWWYMPVGSLEVTQISVMRWPHEEIVTSIGQAQPFMVKIWRTDIYGNQA